MERIAENGPLTAFHLKIIALITMLTDHVAAVFPFPGPAEGLLRGIGRVAFPLYAFLIAEGCRHTRSREKYLLRLGLFGLASQLPFVLAFYPWAWEYRWQTCMLEPGNVFYTLFFAVACVHIWETLRRQSRAVQLAASGAFAACLALWACILFRVTGSAWPFILMFLAYTAALLAVCCFLGRRGGAGTPDRPGDLLSALPLLPVFFVAELLDCDYGVFGMALICLLYLAKPRKLQAAVLALGMCYEYGWEGGLRLKYAWHNSQAAGWEHILTVRAALPLCFALLAVVLVCFYNGRRGKNVKWAFYAAYPAHIAVLAALRLAAGL